MTPHGTTGPDRLARSHHAGFELGLVGHHRIVPRRVEDHVDVGLDHGGNHLDFFAHVVDQDVAHAAAGCGQGQLDVDTALARLAVLEADVVDQAEVDHVGQI